MKLNHHIDNANGNCSGIEEEPLLIQQHLSYARNSDDIHLMLQSHQPTSAQTDETDGARAANCFYNPPSQTIQTNYENVNLCNSIYVIHPSNNSISESTSPFAQQYATKELPSGLRTSVTNSLISEHFNSSDAEPLNVKFHLPRSPHCFITPNNRHEPNSAEEHHQNGYVIYPLQHTISQPEHHYGKRAMEPIYYAKNNESTWPSRIPVSNNDLVPHLETISNRSPCTMKPPPYTYAKAFTRMTPDDLMLYESFRNKTLSNGDVHVSNDQNVYNDNENGPTNGTDSNQNQETDSDDVVHNIDSSIDEYVNEDEKHTNKQIFATKNVTGSVNGAKNVRIGKPWMFGVHKNPKVVSSK